MAFNPTQPRDGDGRWTDGGRFGTQNGELLFAILDSPAGREVRLSARALTGDDPDFTGEDDDTASLNRRALRRLRDDLADAAAAGKAGAKVANAIYDRGEQPSDDQLDGLAQGQVAGVQFVVDLDGLDPLSWQLTLHTSDPETTDGVTLEPREVAKLLKKLDALDEQLAGDASRHLPGRHNQAKHGRRFNTPGDRASGVLSEGREGKSRDRRVGTSELRLDDEVRVTPRPVNEQHMRLLAGRVGRLTSGEGGQWHVEFTDGGAGPRTQVIDRRDLTVTRPAGDPSLEAEDRERQDREQAERDRRAAERRPVVARYSPDQPRVEAGSASGGQFAAADSGGRKKSNGSETLSYDPKTNRGTGYGTAGGDDRVKGLQEALNRLGLTDAEGKPLKVDGKLGPKTTAAIKKAQRKLGVAADGKVTPELLKRIVAMKGAKPAATTTPRKAPAKAAPKKAAPKKATGGRMVARGEFSVLTYDRTYPLDDIQIQRSGDGRTVEAYAAMFDAPYEVRDQHGHYMEVINRAAFNRTLNGAGRNAMCLYNHGRNLEGQPDSLASIPLGTPLEIRPDGRGLLTVTRYNRGPYTDQVLEAVRNGDIKAQSFRGAIYRSDPAGRLPRNRYGQPLPTVTRHELGLTDYGPTPIPVNQGAEIVAVRSVQDVLEYLESLDADERAELLRSLDLDESTPYEDPDDEDEEEEDEVDEEDDLDETATSERSELGAEDPPAERAHSGRQADLTRRIRVAMLIRSRK